MKINCNSTIIKMRNKRKKRRKRKRKRNMELRRSSSSSCSRGTWTKELILRTRQSLRRAMNLTIAS